MTNPEFGLGNNLPEHYQPSSPDIPEVVPMLGWKDTPIEESSQPLILLNGLHERVKTHPMYHILGIQHASEEMYLRAEASERLIKAAESLPPQFSLVVFDAHRPIEVQRELFDGQKRVFSYQFPDLSEREISQMTETYVSLPSTNSSRPSPHSTGGAIDLSIIDDTYGDLLEMGTDWDSFDIKSRTVFFRTINPFFHQNRNLLYRVMTSAGFTNYPEEWWHYDFGNQFWGHILKRDAIYGLIEGGDSNDRTR